ncbi:DUF1648 domain-containing protein [Cytobacillus spongiae]|uniref:DUF1648 domain-containing protein n=1 Tax=Cytobacillus spongiae TaxID=2901381 RepID=UPI001F276D16|nr:DUF5808 domain-containing protein [Cytobacillus spongiae]UII55227.1 DUF1648 domain-containing protein [Cytobacillus spongiae]
MEFYLLLMVLLFVSAIQVAIPFIIKRTVVFGVSIPYEQAKNPEVIAFKRIYALITLLIGAIVTIGFIILQQSYQDGTELVVYGVAFPFIILFSSLALYFYFHFKMIKLKKAKQWYSMVKQVRITDLTIRSKDEMLPSFLHFIPSLLTIALMLLTVPLYDQLPSEIPTHWGPNGEADAFTTKSWLSVLQLPIILLILQFMFFGINLATMKSGIKVNAGNTQASSLRQLRLRKYTSWFLFVTNLLMTILFSFLQLNLLYEDLIGNSILVVAPLSFFFITLAGALYLAVKVGVVDSDLEGKVIVEETNKQEGIDEDQYWKGGLIYFNRNDPSIFVEKRFGIGYTMNFANPLGYFILLLPIALILFLAFANY